MAEEVVVNIKVNASGVKSTLNSTKNEFGNFSNDLQKSLGIKGVAIGTALGNGITSAIGSAIGTAKSLISGGFNTIIDSVSKAADLQQVALSLEVMLGDANKAKKLLTDLEAFAMVTPFNLTELQGLTKQLIAYGIAQEDLIPTMQRLGNIAAGFGGDALPRLAYAFGQIKAVGHLTGMELRQINEIGIPLLDALSNSLGKTKDEIMGMVSKGEISFDTVNSALENMSNNWGDLMGRQSKTLKGVISNFQDLKDSALRSIGGINAAGELVEGGLLDVLQEKLTSLLGWFNANQDKVTVFAQAIGTTLGAALEKMIDYLGVQLPRAWEWIQQNGPQIWEDLKLNIDAVYNSIKNFYDFISTNWEKIESVLGTIKNINDAAGKLQQYNFLNPTTGIKMLGDAFGKAKEGVNGLGSALGWSSSQAWGLSNALNNAASAAERVSYAQNYVRQMVLGYANGGIVPQAAGGLIPGNSHTGDRMNVAVNSGEMIINKSQQAALFQLLKQVVAKPQVINANFSNGQRGERQEMSMFSNLLMNI